MAIFGRYKTVDGKDKGPYVSAYLFFPRLDVYGPAEFLVDSGADSTMLRPARDLEIIIPYHLVRTDVYGVATGVGGQQRCFIEQCMLSFRDEQYRYVRRFLNIFIAEVATSAVMEASPSLLGRDFLNLCDVRLNHVQNLVSLDPLNVESGFILPP